MILSSLMMWMVFAASLALPVVAVVAGVTYVRRTRQLERMEGDGSHYGAVLDHLQQVHVRLDAINDRLAGMEEEMRVARRRTYEALGRGED